MRTIKPTESFTAYPGGKRREFEEGVEVSVPAAFAEMMINKGVAKEVGGDDEAAEEETTTKRSKAGS